MKNQFNNKKISQAKSMKTPESTPMKISFSPPYVDEDVIASVVETLKSGWITTGPKVKELERLTEELTGCQKSICVNSWSSGALLVFKWLGIGEGDEVILPSYTYAATALTVLHAGARPVMVDVNEDFNINVNAISAAITPKTKAVIGVDLSGYPCDYNEIMDVICCQENRSLFCPSNENQEKLGRILLISDAAHSIGATYGGKPAALFSDITIFSLHAVKNITTAEGGIICLNLPDNFKPEEVFRWMKLNSLNGQTKDAFTKTESADWKYDIVSAGLKINMPDVLAAIGLAQMKKYQDFLLPMRQRIYRRYYERLTKHSWVYLLPQETPHKKSSFHFLPLRIRGIQAYQRDSILEFLKTNGVSANVHFVPLPSLTLFKSLGYNIQQHPIAAACFETEISLPIYPQLSDDQCDYIMYIIEKAYENVFSTEIL